MTYPPQPLAGRAPRVRATEHTPAVLRFPTGDCVTGTLEVISSTGGLLSLSKPLIRGTRIKVMFLTQRGPVLGAAEMLSPVSWTEQPFRFVALAYGDQRRLKAITGDSSKLEKPSPEQTRPTTSRVAPSEDDAPEGAILNTEPDWIDKYRDAVSRNPPRRPLLERMLEALTPGSK
jgi:hypothetical protein